MTVPKTSQDGTVLTERSRDVLVVTMARPHVEPIAVNARLATEASKAIVRPTHQLLEAAAWRVQRGYVDKVMSSEDARDGASAFVQRREPTWKGG